MLNFREIFVMQVRKFREAPSSRENKTQNVMLAYENRTPDTRKIKTLWT